MWLRRTLVAGTFFGMLASYRLWLTSRRFPLVPIADWFPILQPPWDAVFFALLLALLVAALWFYRWSVALFLGGALFLVLGDQTRLQPWFYLYGVMLLLTLFPDRAALAGCRVALSGVYVWSGIQKLNGAFFDEVVPWFAEPALRWFSEAWAEPVEFAIAASPLLEIFIGAAVWLAPLRRFAVAAGILLHAVILLFLGPLGHDYNLVVWPWNLTMPLLILALYSPRSIGRPWRPLRQTKPALAVVLIFVGLPVLSFFGLWDSSLSFCMYSGNTARLDLFVSPTLARRLPAWLQPFVVGTEAGRPAVDVMVWALAEVGVPPLGEPRSFRALARYVARFARSPDDLQLVVVPRVGRATVHDAAAFNASIRR